MMTLTKGWSIKAVPYYARKRQAWEDKIDQMGVPAVTVIVVPRERFSSIPRSLECLYRKTNVPFNLVYVDGGSSEKTKRYLEAEARARGFRLIRSPRYLTPTEARNLGLQQIRSKYVVFIDDDVLVSPAGCGRFSGA